MLSGVLTSIKSGKQLTHIAITEQFCRISFIRLATHRYLQTPQTMEHGQRNHDLNMNASRLFYNGIDTSSLFNFFLASTLMFRAYM